LNFITNPVQASVHGVEFFFKSGHRNRALLNATIKGFDLARGLRQLRDLNVALRVPNLDLDHPTE
jgi:hypothetical protein